MGEVCGRYVRCRPASLYFATQSLRFGRDFLRCSCWSRSGPQHPSVNINILLDLMIGRKKVSNAVLQRRAGMRPSPAWSLHFNRQDASFNIQGPFGFVKRRVKAFDFPVLESEDHRLLFQSSGKFSRAGRDRSFCSI